MKINELQIGDWVYMEGDYPCRIHSLTGPYPRKNKKIDNKPLIDVWVGDGFLTCQEEEISGIPITEEILMKNGFVKGRSFLSDTFTYNEFRVHKSNTNCMLCRIHKEKEYPLTVVDYVHELQHMLRLCFLIDLAENFKI